MILTFIAGIFIGIMIHYKINLETEKQNEKLIENIKRLEQRKKINPKMFLSKKELKNGKSKSI
tara:strand:+ start:67 stop:255 length:189 start_codon:yes stop_codon:yes gene_type:complete